MVYDWRMFKALGEILSHYDWAAIIGWGLALAFILLVVVPGLNVISEKGQQKPEDYASYKSSQSESISESSNDKITNYTWWLAVLTGALAVVSAIQIGFLIRADNTSRIIANATKAGTDALPTMERAHVYPTIVSAGALRECADGNHDFLSQRARSG
jgi:ABC-type Fe3+ transport system permease subunit